MSIIFFTLGKDQGLVSLLEWFDPYHAIWNELAGRGALVIDNGRIYTVH